MINKYTASCAICGKPVEAGTGETNKRDGRWLTKHVGQCRRVGIDASYRFAPYEPEPDPWNEAEWVSATLPDLGDHY